MAIRHGMVETFHDDQLVVALPDLRTVTGALHRLGVRWGKTESSPALGLGLVSGLTKVPAAVRTLEEDFGPELQRFRAERAGISPGAPPLADLDLLIKGIRLQLARTFPGWEVTIGKNYAPSLVKGYPHIGGGGNGDPQPARATPGSPAAVRHRSSALGRGVGVGLLDTRIFPDGRLAGHYIARPDDLLDPAKRTFTMFDGHCAFVGSCILWHAPAAELHIRHVLDHHGNGTAWHAAVAMAELAQAGVDVVNLSFGEYLTDDNAAPMVLEAGVKRFGPDTVVVAAAGNNGDVKNLPAELVREGVKPNSASYPAALPDVVGVGAVDEHGKRAVFTPDPAPWIALLAPGVGLTGAYVQGEVAIEHKNRDGETLHEKLVPFHGTAKWEGCSFAAAVVSGAIAAGTVPGRRSAREALETLLRKPRYGIIPNNPHS
jgi:membrane-anchored mycosin MYCP